MTVSNGARGFRPPRLSPQTSALQKPLLHPLITSPTTA